MRGTEAYTLLTALELSQAIHRKQVSCQEVMRCALERIHAENAAYNAIVQLASEEAVMQQAREHDVLLATGTSKGWLHGIPVAIKDLAHATGFVTTSGSRVQRNFLPAQDSLHVARMKAAGAIVIGKTNTPEWARDLRRNRDRSPLVTAMALSLPSRIN